MNSQEVLSKIEDIITNERIKKNEIMKNYTSFKIGGPADFLVEIANIEELKQILKLIKLNNIPLTVIGNGSNILVKEKGIRGIVIKLELNEIEIKNIENERFEITLGSGVKLGYLAQILLKKEIAGFEEFSGIPGTIGGAVLMNAGAHGKEMKDIVKEVKAIDYDGIEHIFTNEESEFDYRTSKYAKENKYIIVQTKIILEKGKKEQIKEKMNQYLQFRKEKQPIEYPSAGSTFKRGSDFITAKLIDDAGLKGYSIGGAQVSEKHAGFIINKGNATADDVLNLVKYVQDKVYEKFGKKIELEIKIIQ